MSEAGRLRASGAALHNSPEHLLYERCLANYAATLSASSPSPRHPSRFVYNARKVPTHPENLVFARGKVSYVLLSSEETQPWRVEPILTPKSPDRSRLSQLKPSHNQDGCTKYLRNFPRMTSEGRIPNRDARVNFGRVAGLCQRPVSGTKRGGW